MSKREVADYLQDILDAVAAIEQFTTGINFEGFSQNLEKVFAVSRAIEIIGEAVKRLPDSVRSQYPDIPWRDIAGMRDENEVFGVGEAGSPDIFNLISVNLP